jgi:D-3-phosphoglycerate dehydrogenase
MYKIQKLNNISLVGLERLNRDRYETASEFTNPDAIMLRSYNMHDMEIPASVKAVGRAGAGVNNIPVEKLTERGIPVFNAPGANANAVKELVVAGMLLAARHICPAWDYVRRLDGDDTALAKEVEAGKKRFKGFELPGRTIGVIGLGSVGVKVANAARDLGMRVLGYDPNMTILNAWRLHSGVERALSVDDLVSRSDFITVHVPFNDNTESLINAERLRMAKQDVVVLNFARHGIVDEAAMQQVLGEERAQAYVTDFPSQAMKNHHGCVALPHLGASTREAEVNCAVMMADQLKDYLETGNITNSVNFPEAVMPRSENCCRMAIVNANVPNMVGQISAVLARYDMNIADLLNKSRDKIAYTLVDVDTPIPQEAIEEIAGIEGVMSVRNLELDG